MRRPNIIAVCVGSASQSLLDPTYKNCLVQPAFASTNTTQDGLPAGGWVPAERLPIRKAIDAYTRDAAWASFDELRKGQLTRDMLADIVVLTDDIFSGPASRLTTTEVAVTIADGKVVYRRDPPENTTAP